MFDPEINIICRHLLDMFQLSGITYVTFYTKLQIMTFRLHIKIKHAPQSIFYNVDIYSNGKFHVYIFEFVYNLLTVVNK